MRNYTHQQLRICTIQKRGGRFCEREAHPDSPYSVCGQHLAAIGSFVLQKAKHDINVHGIPGSVVYYVRIQDEIKIGRSSAMVKRLKSFRLTEKDLLAVEVGNAAVERERHKQFAHLRSEQDGYREHFRLGEELASHINELRAKNGVPNLAKIDAYQREQRGILDAPPEADFVQTIPRQRWGNQSKTSKRSVRATT